MPSPEIEEFARILVRQVRDLSVQCADIELRPTTMSVSAKRWRESAAGEQGARPDPNVVIPDCIDYTIFYLLHAIDEGLLHLKFVSSSGKEVDLTEEGLGELAGWYAGVEWIKMYSQERFVDDFADIDPD